MLPQVQELCPATEGVHKLVVSVAPGFLTVRRQEVGPTRCQVSGDVLHDDGDGVRVLVESGVEFVVRHLLDGSIRQTLVGLESVDDSGYEFGGDVHAMSFYAVSLLFPDPPRTHHRLAR